MPIKTNTNFVITQLQTSSPELFSTSSRHLLPAIREPPSGLDCHHSSAWARKRTTSKPHRYFKRAPTQPELRASLICFVCKSGRSRISRKTDAKLSKNKHLFGGSQLGSNGHRLTAPPPPPVGNFPRRTNLITPIKMAIKMRFNNTLTSGRAGRPAHIYHRTKPCPNIELCMVFFFGGCTAEATATALVCPPAEAS